VSNYCHIQWQGLLHDAERDLLAIAKFPVFTSSYNACTVILIDTQNYDDLGEALKIGVPWAPKYLHPAVQMIRR